MPSPPAVVYSTQEHWMPEGIFRWEACMVQWCIACSLTMASSMQTHDRHSTILGGPQEFLPRCMFRCTLSKYHQEKSIIQNTQVTIYNSFLLSVFSGSCFCYSYCISRKSERMPAWKTEKRPIMHGSREPYATWEQLSPTFSPKGENREYINCQQPLSKGACIPNQSSL